MKALTDAELAALILKAVEAERAACAALCATIIERCGTIRERSVGFGCYMAILDRGRAAWAESAGSTRIDGPVSKSDTVQHETSKPN